MSKLSKLQRAIYLVNNENAGLQELKSAVSDINILLVNNSQSLDRRVRNEYARVLSQLNQKLSTAMTADKELKAENQIKKQEAREEYLNSKIHEAEQSRVERLTSSLPQQETYIYKRGEKKFQLPQFFPISATKDDIIWLRYSDMNDLKRNNRKLYTSIDTEIVLTEKVPDSWIGDLRIQSVYKKEHRRTLEAEPVLNLDRISNLFRLYQAPNYKPDDEGEMFWVGNSIRRANSFSDLNSPRTKKNSKTADYLVTMDGFIIFLYGLNNEILDEETAPYDFLYLGANYNGKSGKAQFVKDSIRKTVIKYVDDYLKNN